MKQPKGLGRGLDAIFGTDRVDAKLKPMSQMSEIDITVIPNPRSRAFDEAARTNWPTRSASWGSSSP